MTGEVGLVVENAFGIRWRHEDERDRDECRQKAASRGEPHPTEPMENVDGMSLSLHARFGLPQSNPRRKEIEVGNEVHEDGEIDQNVVGLLHGGLFAAK